MKRIYAAVLTVMLLIAAASCAYGGKRGDAAPLAEALTTYKPYDVETIETIETPQPTAQTTTPPTAPPTIPPAATPTAIPTAAPTAVPTSVVVDVGRISDELPPLRVDLHRSKDSWLLLSLYWDGEDEPFQTLYTSIRYSDVLTDGNGLKAGDFDMDGVSELLVTFESGIALGYELFKWDGEGLNPAWHDGPGFVSVRRMNVYWPSVYALAPIEPPKYCRAYVQNATIGDSPREIYDFEPKTAAPLENERDIASADGFDDWRDALLFGGLADLPIKHTYIPYNAAAGYGDNGDSAWANIGRVTAGEEDITITVRETELTWEEGLGYNFCAIDLTRADGRPLQTIEMKAARMVSSVGLGYGVWLDDLNFDGVNELIISLGDGGAHANAGHNIYLWDKERAVFEKVTDEKGEDYFIWNDYTRLPERGLVCFYKSSGSYSVYKAFDGHLREMRRVDHDFKRADPRIIVRNYDYDGNVISDDEYPYIENKNWGEVMDWNDELLYGGL